MSEDATATEASAKIPAMALTYGSFLMMALLSISLGAFRSVTSQDKFRISEWRAAATPILLSCVLYCMYLYVQFFNNDYANQFISLFLSVKGIVELTLTMAPVVTHLVPANLGPLRSFHLSLGVSTLVGIWYFVTKHWLANNIFVLSCVVNLIERLHLNNFRTGCILLGGFFIYDIFWVFGSELLFGTNVMEHVAKSLELPNKLLFPKDLLENGFDAKAMAMLGSGDISFPGILIGLLLCYDNNLRPNSYLYFFTAIAAYISGLVLAFSVGHCYSHSQLYLAPACLGAPIVVAFIRGNLATLLEYSNDPEKRHAQ